MSETYGTYVDLTSDAGSEYLHLSFSSGSMPLKQRWRNNGLSADFLGDYVTTFFPKEAGEEGGASRSEEIRSAVSYIANELLENAMKYAHDGRGEPIAIYVHLYPDRILFEESNGVTAEQAKRLRAFIAQLQESDPDELFVSRMEANAVEGGSAGLGFLTMTNDYEAQLAWSFAQGPGGGLVVSTQVTIRV